jgi:hypothetical protein
MTTEANAQAPAAGGAMEPRRSSRRDEMTTADEAIAELGGAS